MNSKTKRDIRELLDASSFPIFQKQTVYCLPRSIFKLLKNLQDSSANSLVLDIPFYSNHSLRELLLPDVASVLSDCLLHLSVLGMKLNIFLLFLIEENVLK